MRMVRDPRPSAAMGPQRGDKRCISLLFGKLFRRYRRYRLALDRSGNWLCFARSAALLSTARLLPICGNWLCFARRISRPLSPCRRILPGLGRLALFSTIARDPGHGLAYL